MSEKAAPKNANEWEQLWWALDRMEQKRIRPECFYCNDPTDAKNFIVSKNGTIRWFCVTEQSVVERTGKMNCSRLAANDCDPNETPHIPSDASIGSIP